MYKNLKNEEDRGIRGMKNSFKKFMQIVTMKPATFNCSYKNKGNIGY